jgi:hypothetical protein
MKTKILIVLLILSCSRLSSQDIAASANGLKSDKQLKKERKEAEKNLMYIAMGEFLDSMHFILKADYLYNTMGVRSIVTPTLNFILVDSAKGVIQTGRDFGIGRNGVGGATANGTITNWKLTKNEKKKMYSIRIDMSTDLGFYNVFMTVASDGSASASLSGISRGSITFEGKLAPLKRSRVFKGMSGF